MAKKNMSDIHLEDYSAEYEEKKKGMSPWIRKK